MITRCAWPASDPLMIKYHDEEWGVPLFDDRKIFEFIWHLSDNKTIHNTWSTINQIPPRSELSDKISLDMKKRGFKFAGTTIIYAFIQAMGVVNDHTLDCFRYQELLLMNSENR
jgi:3-methyladenine DNA glycosylase Tag